MLLLLLAFLSSPASAGKSCTCTCVTKSDEGKYVTVTASGQDRTAAGEKLKKELGKGRTCELTPECEGKGCKLD